MDNKTQQPQTNNVFSADAIRQRRIDEKKLLLTTSEIAPYFPAEQVKAIFERIVFNRTTKVRAITKDFFYGRRKDLRAIDQNWFLQVARQEPETFGDLIAVLSEMTKTKIGTVEYYELPESIWNQQSFSANRIIADIAKARPYMSEEAFKQEVLSLMRQLPDLLS